MPSIQDHIDKAMRTVQLPLNPRNSHGNPAPQVVPFSYMPKPRNGNKPKRSTRVDLPGTDRRSNGTSETT